MQWFGGKPSPPPQTLAVTLSLDPALMALVKTFTSNQEKIMAGITDIQSAQAAEKADLATLTGLIGQLLAAFASGAMTPAQAQAVLDEINAEDSTVKSNITTIQAALPPAAPAPPPQP